MMKYFCLRREFLSGTIAVYPLDAHDKGEAWQEIEDNYGSNNSQEWLLDEGEVSALKKTLESLEASP